MYVTDGQTDGQKQTLLPPSYGRGIINVYSDVLSSNNKNDKRMYKQ